MNASSIPTRQFARLIAASDAEIVAETRRPQPIVAETFEAFLLLRDGEMRFDNTKPTFDECRDLCAAGTPHKGQFVVKRTNHLSGAVTLHLFQIRQGARKYVVRDHVPGWVQDPYPDHLADIRVVEPQYPDEAARRVGSPVGPVRAVGQ